MPSIPSLVGGAHTIIAYQRRRLSQQQPAAPTAAAAAAAAVALAAAATHAPVPQRLDIGAVDAAHGGERGVDAGQVVGAQVLLDHLRWLVLVAGRVIGSWEGKDWSWVG